MLCLAERTETQVSGLTRSHQAESQCFLVSNFITQRPCKNSTNTSYKLRVQGDCCSEGISLQSKGLTLKGLYVKMNNFSMGHM